MTEPRLPISTPSAQGVDTAGISAFLDALEADPAIEPHSLMIVRHGSVISAGWWAPYGPDRVHLLYSLSKSFTSTATGFAVSEGLVDLDRSVLSYFPELDHDVTDPRSRALLVRHVASMASGHTAETLDRATAEDSVDLVRGFLRVAPDCDPGTVFAYNQPNTFALAAIVQRVTGQPLTSYLRPRLFEPLGIGEAIWQRDDSGREIGFSGLHAGTDAIAALGQLYLDRGVWKGHRLLDDAWIAEATRSHISTAGEPTPEWQQGYGFQFWRSRNGYRGDGAYGQFCLVLPDHDAVVAITAATEEMQLLLDAVWQHLLPAFGDRPGDGSGDAALADRLATLALPVPDTAPEPSSDSSAWMATSFSPAGGSCAPQPTLRSVELAVAGGRWALTLAEQGSRLTAVLGNDEWAISDANGPDGTVTLAVAGGWTSPQRLNVEVIFLETPHRLVVICDLSSRTFTAAWATAPLGGGALHSLRAPRHHTGQN
ncbi:CubicO group peptidase (beta-lactamase class C family) [Nakamurella sp. UYEF19]|uniref:serine hydrolase domain-containing protein n=1 Tax=Nakamurella sp. UYEF19 TaxID=1756392 RepID=UPI0033930503